jgi:hypothetical protein
VPRCQMRGKVCTATIAHLWKSAPAWVFSQQLPPPSTQPTHPCVLLWHCRRAVLPCPCGGAADAARPSPTAASPSRDAVQALQLQEGQVPEAVLCVLWSRWARSSVRLEHHSTLLHFLAAQMHKQQGGLISQVVGMHHSGP